MEQRRSDAFDWQWLALMAALVVETVVFVTAQGDHECSAPAGLSVRPVRPHISTRAVTSSTDRGA
jgi:hypothetical protein